jgi:hypothetical protein
MSALLDSSAGTGGKKMGTDENGDQEAGLFLLRPAWFPTARVIFLFIYSPFVP